MSEVEDQRAIDIGIEVPVERIEARVIAKRGGFDTALQEPISPALHFVVDEQTEEIDWP